MKLKPGVTIRINRKKYENEIPDEILKKFESNFKDKKDFSSWKKKYELDSKKVENGSAESSG